ncbi:MAG: metallophosphoesterase family protein [Saccharofermentanales bacterium]
MKYAIISDIHGNIDALKAVLMDAEHFNVDKYIFVGDYCTCLPYPNEVIDVFKSLKNAILVQGNEESRLFDFEKQDRNTWTDGQFQATYWCCRTIEKENYRYLESLPKLFSFTDNKTNISITHSSSDFIGNAEHKEFSSSKVTTKYERNTPISRIAMLTDIREYLNADIEFNEINQSLSDGVYIFGHTHVQWNAQFGNKIYINPGSCGVPLDGEEGAPYTLLFIENDKVLITERRVAYDIEGLINRYKNSSLYEAANIWGNLIINEMLTSFETITFFLQFVNDYANSINDPIRPFSCKTWTEAYRTWARKEAK